MAQNRWASEYVEGGKRDGAYKVAGAKVVELAGQDEKEAADTDGSVLKIARLPANAVITEFLLNNDAIAGLTDVDAGLYKEDGSSAVDADKLMDGADLSGGKAIGSEQNGLAAIGVDGIGKKLWELLGYTELNKPEGFVLALTLNTAGANVGTISWRLKYILAAG